MAKALPDPDLKYRSSLRALSSSVTATYERRITGRYLHVDVMIRKPAAKIVRRADIDVAVAELEKINVPQAAIVSLRSDGASGDTLRSAGLRVACHPKPVRAKGGGDGGIRTLDRALQPYNGLANRRLQPLGHISDKADMPDAEASRKRPIRGCRIPGPLATPGSGPRLSKPSVRLKPRTPEPVIC